MTNWLAGMRITADRLNDNTSTSTTSGLTAATGFSVNSFLGRKVSGVTVLDIYMQRTGADITATGGNITDTQICTVPAGWRPPDQTINGTWDNGAAEGGWVVGTDGVCTLRTSNGTITGTAGSGVSNLRLHIEFISDNN
ncbi:MAG: hypothetical protein HOV92_18190 [Streptomyces sp.]|nr:hypothetical protein [Streptomyces sp.]